MIRCYGNIAYPSDIHSILGHTIPKLLSIQHSNFTFNHYSLRERILMGHGLAVGTTTAHLDDDDDGQI